MSRGHRIKQATAKFNKSAIPRFSVSVDIPSLVLTNPAIYTALANYIIHYRMATLDYVIVQEIVHNYFKNIYIPVMVAEAQQLKLSQGNITELKRLAVRLMNTITSDAKITPPGPQPIWYIFIRIQIYFTISLMKMLSLKCKNYTIASFVANNEKRIRN